MKESVGGTVDVGVRVDAVGGVDVASDNPEVTVVGMVG
jgi:hypothetical protein